MESTITIPNFDKTRILIIGDVMLDSYWHGGTDRISPEAPVPVVQVERAEERPGGAANVALNIAALGGQAILLGFSGADEYADLLESKIRAANITCHLLRQPNKPTIRKLRILSLHQQLIRLDFESSFNDCDATTLVEIYKNTLKDVSAVIVSDYGKGTLACVKQLITLAKEANVPILVDPKGRDFSLYHGATLLTPNKKEFEEVVGVCKDEGDLIAKSQKLIHDRALGGLLITRGSQGMTLLQAEKSEFHLPAIAREVYDVTGAGDTVIAVLALAIGAGCSYEVATVLANRAAGLVVGKLGTSTVSLPELRQAIHNDQNYSHGVMSQEQLLIAVADAKARGERIVMTNGCFDILHSGHVSYLEQAKKLGDRLIIAVNDDRSVAALKGPERPINTLDRRMDVLAALSAVDWVVPFTEDTPEKLINEVVPDVLVKGGDYQVHEIAGHICVLANGGEVRILPFKEGCSTSAIVARIKQEEIA